MLSDEVSGVIERYFQRYYLPLVKDARLFRIEPPERTPSRTADLSSWEPDERVVENYRLPFGSIVIEEASEREANTKSCAFLWDVDVERRRFGFVCATTRGARELDILFGEFTAFPNKRMADTERALMLDIEPGARAYRLQRAAHPSLVKKPELLGEKAHEIAQQMDDDGEAAGLIRSHDEQGFRDYLNKQALQLGVSKQQAYSNHMAKLHERMARFSQGVLVCTLNLYALTVVKINEPSKFVVEERPLQPLRHPMGGLPRSPWRSHFVVLEPLEIKTRLLGVDPNPPSGLKRAPHEKRGHFRRLTADRFKEKRGSVIWIRPCWVGPKEGIVGKNQYIVRLDADRAPAGTPA